ncbi:MAG: nucleotide sugar dehydrogenase [Geovibrio sp.]|nr:nucleotide sugar dehydrogenase [Geovibrio sp.]
MFKHSDIKICILGLGYVGLPLAVEFSKKYYVCGFDINSRRISELASGYDKTCEVPSEALKSSNIRLTSDVKDIKECNVFIVTVPTPIDQHKNPDLSPILGATETVGRVLKKGDIVVYESTVYPGCTEEDCVPVLEKMSGLRFNTDFFCGYSPERINPGDKGRGVKDITKVTSGSTPDVADFIDGIYASVITAGTHKAPSIKVAEAAKVIENTQRDINIALMNELALIFDKMGVDTASVLEAASTKWNFLRFEPGLVGGHCIGVDPYYLTFKAQSLDYIPNMILSGRKINDGMGKFIAEKTIKMMIAADFPVKNSKVLLAGITFKENCPDIRNTRVIDIYRELREYGVCVDIYDPVADPSDVKEEYGIEMIDKPADDYNAVIVAVKHSRFLNGGLKLGSLLTKNGIIIDVKGALPAESIGGFSYWRL